MNIRTFLPLSLLGLLACAGDAKTTEEPVTTATASATADASATAPATASATSSAAAPAALPPVTLEAGTPAAAPEKAPTLKITAPTAGQLIPADKAPDFEVKLDLKGWDVPANANHVHVILDGKPYKRIDDPKAPIKLKDLDAAPLAEGQHVLVAFPSRSTHESVKPIGKAAPVAVTTFYVGKKEGSWKTTDPTLVFSRPKGANDGAPPAEGILVDWYLLNAELGDGKHSVEATLTGPGVEAGQKVSIKAWTPWRIKNVRDGKYTLHMSLLGKDGKVVPGPMNDVTREFTVNTKGAPDHQHPAAAPAAAPTK